MTSAKIILALLLLSGAAYAEAPSEEAKRAALLRAYHLNGDRMVGWGSIDLTGTSPSEDGKTKCVQIDGPVTGQQFFECHEPVKTIQVKPQEAPVNWSDKNALDKAAEEAPDLNMNDIRKFLRRHNRKVIDAAGSDICAVHHMRKVVTGSSWRCRK